MKHLQVGVASLTDEEINELSQMVNDYLVQHGSFQFIGVVND